jgi:tRNA A37 methylthiotransferase MiaB
MMNPNHVLKFKAELYEMYKHPKVFKFIHLPLQSGSNEILKKMRRNYTIEEFKSLYQEMKMLFPEMNFATDIIVGFPGETDDQYLDTQKAIRDFMPDVINISRFWPRPGTPAAKLTPLAGEVVKHRSRVMTDIYHNIARMQNERWRNWEGEIIVDEKGTEAGQWIGRNDSFKPIIVEGDYKLGQRLKVKVEKTTTFDLRAKVLNVVV